MAQATVVGEGRGTERGGMHTACCVYAHVTYHERTGWRRAGECG